MNISGEEDLQKYGGKDLSVSKHNQHIPVIYPPEILTSKLHLSQDQTIVNFHMVISDHLLLSGIDNGHYKESHQWYQWIGLRDNFNRFEPHFVW